MRKVLFAFLVLLGFISYFLLTKDYSHENEIIYFGGNIITMKDTTNQVDAIFVKDGKIIETGKKDDIFKLKTPNTQLVDLRGKTLMPGFFDPHGHFDLATVFAGMIDISGVKYRKAADVLNIMKTTCKNAKPDDWIFFYGLDPVLTKDIKSPTIQYLDSIAPDKNVIVITKALHVFYANSKAFAALGITDKTPDPSKGSYYERDSTGKLTGGIVEQAALEPVKLKIQEIAKRDYLVNTQKVMNDYAKIGVTSIVNMGLTNTNKNIITLYEHLAAYQPKPLSNALQLIGKLPERQPASRIFLYLRKEYDSFLPEKVEKGDDFFKIIGIKLW